MKFLSQTLKIALFYQITSICFHGIYFTYPTHKKIVIHRTLTSKAIWSVLLEKKLKSSRENISKSLFLSARLCGRCPLQLYLDSPGGDINDMGFLRMWWFHVSSRKQKSGVADFFWATAWFVRPNLNSPCKRTVAKSVKTIEFNMQQSLLAAGFM